MNFLFDVDGTLTESRTQMDKSFTVSFLNWMSDKSVYLVTGSDIEKTLQQIPQSVVSRCNGIFSSMGNVLHVDDKIVYINDFKIDDSILMNINGRLCSSNCPQEYRATKHYEFRPGMLNFSFCGRDVTRQQRKQYNKWDTKHGERAQFVEWFNERYGSENLEACLGGEISVDIQPVGSNKSLAVKWVAENDNGSIIFFGDRCSIGGNDYAAREYIDNNKLGKWFQVKSPKETLQILNDYDFSVYK